MKKNFLLTFALLCALSLLSGCGLSFYDDWKNSSEKAVVGAGAVAGKDYVNGLLPSEASRNYFSRLQSNDTPVETVSRFDDTESQSGVKFVKNGGILIPPGVTISFVNRGFCLDPYLAAPTSNEEYQLIPVTKLIPEELLGIYKKLMNKAASDDLTVKNNLQHLVWALRTAGTDSAYANNLTTQQKRILNSCAEYADQFEDFNTAAKSNSKMMKQVLGLADSYLNVSVGGVSYKASDLLDPNVGQKKINEHMNQLIAMGKSQAVEHTGFNFGELQSGIYTDVRGTGAMTFAAKIANSTNQPYTFYPSEYAGQVGSGVSDASSSLSFFATNSSTQRQRITIRTPETISAQKTSLSRNTKTSLEEILGLPTSGTDAAQKLGKKAFDEVYQGVTTVGLKSIARKSGKYAETAKNLLADEKVNATGKTIKSGTWLDFDFGVFVGDFLTDVATGEWDAAAAATEKYTREKTIELAVGTWTTLYTVEYAMGAWVYNQTH